jgi:hypothetical protein
MVYWVLKYWKIYVSLELQECNLSYIPCYKNLTYSFKHKTRVQEYSKL